MPRKVERARSTKKAVARGPRAQKGAWLRREPEPVAPKKLITIRLREDVIELYRATGKGHISLMADVLATYAKEVLTKR